MLTTGGRITGTAGGDRFNHAARLPEGRFQLWGASWTGQDISPKHIGRLHGRPNFSMGYFHLAHLTDEHLQAIAGLPEMDILQLQTGRRSTIGDREVADLLRQLRGVRLVNLRVTGKFFSELPQRDQWTHITLAGSRDKKSRVQPDITRDTLAVLATLPKLVAVDLSYTAPQPEVLKLLANIETLAELTLDAVETAPRALPSLSRLPGLTHLDLNNQRPTHPNPTIRPSTRTASET